jgi:transcriptional regulator with XRE-family HTH domain
MGKRVKRSETGGTGLGTRIREARIHSGLSQTDVAKRLSVSQPLVSQWEQGRSKPDQGKVKELETVVGQLTDDRLPSTGPGPIGVWLSKTRQQKGVSVYELAERAGVTSMAIYNIESGKTQNPQEATRKRLEQALATTAPQEVVKEARVEQDIVGLGPLTDFDPYDDSNLPTCGGVYVLYDVSERPIYVGQGGQIRSRIRDHEEKFWFKRPIVVNGAYVQVEDRLLRTQIEQVLIKFLKSNAVINKQNVDR